MAGLGFQVGTLAIFLENQVSLYSLVSKRNLDYGIVLYEFICVVDDPYHIITYLPNLRIVLD